MRRALVGWALGCSILAGSAAAQSTNARPSFAEPSLSADGATIAFASGGDIWEVPAVGGTAHVLVSGPATEGRPLYSPDGRRLAFTSTRGGSNNIFVLDLASGQVTRLTYAEAGEELDSWSADGRWIYFASGTGDVGGKQDIYRVAASGGTPMAVSRERYVPEYQAAPSPDGQQLVFAARGLSSNQWWRRGSSHIDQNELWMKPIDGAGGYRRLAGDASRHAWPMWQPSGAGIVYMSDAGGTENLWRLATAEGSQPVALTHFTDGRLLYPAMARDGSAILFERDAQIWRADAASGAAAPIAISLRGAPAADGVSHVAISNWSRLAASPDGQKVAVIGHGELFAAAAKDGGPGQRITNSLGAEREVIWSPDSTHLLYITERGTEHLLAEYDFSSGRETLLTAHGVASVPAYAPDGKSIAYVLDDRQLRRLTPARGKQAASDQMLFEGRINSDERNGPGPAWSPDGRWIAFARFDSKAFSNVLLVPAEGGAARPVSFLANGQMSTVRWSAAGDYLLIDTGQRTEEARIVRIDLTPRLPKYKENAFRELFNADKPPGETARATGAKATTASPPPAKPAPKPVTIAWDGLRERATTVPVGLNAFAPLVSPDGKTLIFIASSRGQDNIYSYSLDELASEPAVAQQITQSAKPKSDLALSGDGKTLFYLEGGAAMSTPIDTPKPKAIAITADMDVDFAAEKQVVFDEAWSALDRNFYDAGFNGHDWTALKARFQPLVAGAKTPDELRRTINLMIGELNASHSGINRPARGPGSFPTDRVGQIGARFDRDAAEAGRGLVVSEVIPLSPAAIAGIRPGERLTAIDGSIIGPATNLDRLLENKVGKRVALTIAGAGGNRAAIVQPITQTSAAGLRYRAWVGDRRAMVERLSGGRLGYVHMLDMGEDSLNQLYLDLDATNQARAGVVVDVRNNNGGFVNGHAIDVFARRNYLTMTPRGFAEVPSRQALGQRALGLPTVLVTNESSLSDAEDFTEGYRALGLGKVVGVPTAGWIIFTGSEPLIDGSTVRLPGFRIRDGRGQDMENNPRPVDIRVEQPLGESATGRDAQLEAAVTALLAQIAPR